MRRKKQAKILGFTLTEVMVVVVILGILASLVVPRFLFASEQVIAGEATNMLGAIRRAQVGFADGSGNFLIVPEYQPTNVPYDNSVTAWRRLGLTPPSSASRFSYRCSQKAARCVATRASGEAAGAQIYINLTSGQVTYSTPPYITSPDGTLTGVETGWTGSGVLNYIGVSTVRKFYLPKVEQALAEKNLVPEDLPLEILELWRYAFDRPIAWQQILNAIGEL